jgi:type VI secretion system secreted protein VgrG
MSESILSLLAGAFSQATRLLRFSTSLGEDTLLAESVRGEEALSVPYRFTVSALSLDASISLRALIGQPALLQLLTADDPTGRPFHGHITAATFDGANGGMARYTLTVQPWLAFLGHGRDSRIFQDKTVFDILDAVFGAWEGKGTLAPDWRFDVQERDSYPKRSLTTQYQESDLAFAERLMAEEGLFYFFEHEANGHRMVIADHNGAFAPHGEAPVRFTRPGAVMRADSMDRWRSEVRLGTNAVELSSWDYRTLGMRPASAAGAPDGAELVQRDVPGAYAYEDRAQGARMAERRMQAIEAQREVFTGAGTVRTLRAGSTFQLTGQAVLDVADHDDARTFIVTRVIHLMHNNLSAPLRVGGEAQLGMAALTRQILGELGASLHAVGAGAGERPLYRNRVDAIRVAVPFRAPAAPQRPTIRGQQSAIVVGPAGAVVHTDRDHRVKVQFHWQRGADGMGHSRLDHPAPDGHVGAPADDRAGTWVRVATPLAPVAGANWGANTLPRVGQEVLVDFIEGDIDRPVVIGALYNGKGARDAQNNDVAQGTGAATGNATAWFPGEGGAHAHGAVLSGLKSQALADSQGGTGSFSQLVFDDSPGAARLALQRHASAHAGTDELNLGQLRHHADNARLQPAGFGSELKTQHSAALRAGKGLLLSGDGRNGASGAQMDAREAQAQIESSSELQRSLADMAQKHNARLKKSNGKDEPAPEELPAIAQLAHSAEVLDGVSDGRAGVFGGDGSAPGFSAAMLQLSAPMGIAAVTPASAIVAARGTGALTAGQDIDLAAQANSHVQAQTGVSLFSYGKASAATRPNQETGIRLHAASGKFSSQSHADATRLTADKTVTVASIGKSVNVAAREHVLLTAQGAYIRLEGGNIQIHGPGTMTFKATMKELAGPASVAPELPTLPRETYQYAQKFQLKDSLGTPLANEPYTIYVADQQEVRGKTDAQGLTSLVDTENAESTYIIFDRDLQWICEEEHDDDTDFSTC